jgi:hypothetical protein
MSLQFIVRWQVDNRCVRVRLLPDVSCLGCCHYCALQSCIGLRAVAGDAPLAAPNMDLEDCPLLPAGAVLPLQDPFSGQTILHPETQRHLTLTDLSVSCCCCRNTPVQGSLAGFRVQPRRAVACGKL